jgi:hypothetical protein
LDACIARILFGPHNCKEQLLRTRGFPLVASTAILDLNTSGKLLKKMGIEEYAKTIFGLVNQ